MNCSKTFTLEVRAGCADWLSVTWPAESSSASGTGFWVTTWSANTFSAEAVSPNGITSQARASNDSNALVYNGPGCNCNLHVDVSSVGLPTVLAGVTAQVIKLEGLVALAGFTYPAGGQPADGSYDYPFALPDTLGSDIHLILSVSSISGAFGFAFSSLKLSGSVSNV
jgi:hypothetical protein